MTNHPKQFSAAALRDVNRFGYDPVESKESNFNWTRWWAYDDVWFGKILNGNFYVVIIIKPSIL